MDNQYQTDFVLLEFAGDWALTTVSTASTQEWGGGSSPDFDVFYWSGDDSVIDNDAELIAGQNFSNRDMLGTYQFGEGTYSQTTTVQTVSESAPGVSAKYWLVAASTAYSGYEDFFKLAGVGGDQANAPPPPPPPPPGEPGVPEPASLLLLAAGLPFLRQRRLASRAA